MQTVDLGATGTITAESFAVEVQAVGGETFTAGGTFTNIFAAEDHAETINTWTRQMRAMGGKMTLPTGDGSRIVEVEQAYVVTADGTEV